MNADKAWIIENNGRLINPEIATGGLSLGKLGHRDHNRTILYIKRQHVISHQDLPGHLLLKKYYLPAGLVSVRRKDSKN